MSTLDLTASGQDSTADVSLVPSAFIHAVETMPQTHLREGLPLGTIRPPHKLARYSHVVGLELTRSENDPADNFSELQRDAFGRFILLYDPGNDAEDTAVRVAVHLQADVDNAVAADPLISEKIWQRLYDGLESAAGDYADVQVRSPLPNPCATEILTARPPCTFQIELCASGTVVTSELPGYVAACGEVLARLSGLLPPTTASSLQ